MRTARVHYVKLMEENKKEKHEIKRKFLRKRAHGNFKRLERKEKKQILREGIVITGLLAEGANIS